MNTKQEKTGAAYIMIAGMLWGVIGVFVHELEKYGANVETISAIRVIFAALIMFLITTLQYGIKAFLVDRKTLFVCALLGLICHGIYNIFYSIAVIKAGVAVSAILLDVAPIFTFLFSIMLFHEKVQSQKVVGIVLNIIGCILAVMKPGTGQNTFQWIGILCGIGAGITYSLTAIIGRLAGERTNPFVMSFYSYLSASLFLVIYMMIGNHEFVFDSGIMMVGFLYALIPTAVAYIIYFLGVQRITDSSKVPVFASLEVVVACILGLFVYKEQLQEVNILGIAIVLCSIFVMNISLKEHKLREERTVNEQ